MLALHAGQDLSSMALQVVVRVRPVLPNESSEQVAVTCSEDGGRVQVGNLEAQPACCQPAST